MKPVYFFLGANSEEGFFSLYDQLLGGRLDDLMILKGGPGCGKSTFMRRMLLSWTVPARMCSSRPTRSRANAMSI